MLFFDKQISIAIMFVVLPMLFVVVFLGGDSFPDPKAIKATAAVSAVQFQTEDEKILPPPTTVPPTTTTTHYHPPTTTTQFVPVTMVAPVRSSGVNWDAIAQCESHGNWSTNTGNGYYGGLQFSHSTWLAYGGGRYSDNAHLTSRENQISIASGMGLSHWPHCGRYG